MALLEEVLQQVRSRIVPTDRERDKMAKRADRLQDDVEKILRDSNISGKVTLQGSFARDTWLRNETDIDIFARFPPSMERKEWLDHVLPVLRTGLKEFKVIERFAEHPFLEFHVDHVRVNVVPCYDVEMGHWKSATDRTPYHTEFMKASLTPQLRLEARFLKKFAKGICVYGAEIEVGGFSGMLVDTLALYYGSFIDTIRQASSWTSGTHLEIGKPRTVLDAKKREKGVDLVVVDPVDPDRNLAAAVRQDKLWNFVAAARQFQKVPEVQFFFPPIFQKKSKAQFSKRIMKNSRELVAVVFRHGVLVPDVLWGQLMKLERSLVEMLTREGFEIYRSKIWSDEKSQSAILLEMDRSVLPGVKLQSGPPIEKREDNLSFLQKHLGAIDTIRGPWIQGDRWFVEKMRGASTVPRVVKESLRDPAYGFAIPKQLGERFSRTSKVLQGQETLSLLGKRGFDKALWDFLVAKPEWLKPTK